MIRTEVENNLDILNQKLQKLFAFTSNYTDQVLNLSPGKDKWSPAQIMNHLLLSEKLSVAYCRKKLSFNPTLEKAGFMAKIRTWLITGYLRSPLKFKAPAIIDAPNLPEEDSMENIRIKWEEVRKDLGSFLSEIPDSMLEYELYKHPFGGRISILAMLKVMDAHFENHLQQIRSALADL